MKKTELKIKNNLQKLKETSLEEYLKEKLIISAEQMAELSKKLAHLENNNIQDDALRRLDRELRIAFSNRRSLLLTNLQSQVREDEFPWRKIIKAIEVNSGSSGTGAITSSSSLQDSGWERASYLAHLSLNYFPQMILPNPLVKSIWILTRSNSITRELAADIFGNEFSESFVNSARIAAKLMTGTLYARYYGIPYGRILSDNAGLSGQNKEFSTQEFYEMAYELSNLNKNDFRYSSVVAVNGKIIEWQQIITTHNLAQLHNHILKLDDPNKNGKKRSIDTANWIVSEFVKVYKKGSFDKNYSKMLQRRKDIAYALRQLIFYLSFEDTPFQMEVLDILKKIPAELEKHHLFYKERLQWEDSSRADTHALYSGSIKSSVKSVKIEAEKMIEGLELVINGKSNPNRPFSGWLTGREESDEPMEPDELVGPDESMESYESEPDESMESDESESYKSIESDESESYESMKSESENIGQNSEMAEKYNFKEPPLESPGNVQ